VTVAAGSDATAGLSTDAADYLLEYKSATLQNGDCGAYDDWTDSAVTETYDATSYDFTSTIGNCYQFRYTVEDAAGNSITYTSDDTTIVDTATPDIVAVDAGASDSDRISLISATWFKYTDTGSDDVISFTWTDPGSASDDTFYYELNSTATATIDGTESSVTTNYVNEISISEGTSYFHVRPRNGSLTWGIERIFTVQYDKVDPTVSTPTDEGAISVDQILPFSWTAASDAVSGIASLTVCIDDDKTGDCAKEVSLATNATGYSWIANPTPTWGATYYAKLTAVDSAGNSTISSWSDGVTPDGDAPTVVADKSSSDWYLTNQTVTLSASDAESGLSEARYIWDTNSRAADCTSGGTVFTDATEISFSTEGIHILYLCALDSAENVATWNGTYKLDKADPTVETDTLISPNGSEIWTGGSSATYDITWTAADFTDAASDLTATPITIDYSIDSGSSWTEIATGEANDGTYTWTTPDISDSEVQVRVTATDNAGNTASDASDADFRLSAYDNWVALYISEGNNQSGGIDATLTTDLKIRVGNGASSGEIYAGADAVTVTFTIASTPIEPTAVGQSLADGSFGTTFGGTSTAKTVTTDANGYASVVTTLGDRAGDYTVVGSFTGVETVEASRTFTATEREAFKFTISNPILSMDVDPMVNSTGSSSTTLFVTSNAASYQINIDPTAWPTYEEETIQNWSGGFGFGWDNNGAGTSGGTSTASAFDGLDTPTDAYVCSGDTCQGTVEFTLDFHTAVDYSYEAGTYENTLTVEGANISF
jgi:hypothetical protein